MDRLGLSNPVHPSHGLNVRLGVPIAVKQNASISRLEIQPHTSTASRYQKEKKGRLGFVESTNVVTPAGWFCGSVQTAKLPSTQFAVVFDNVEHRGKLGKNDGTMIVLKESLKEHVQDTQFPRSRHQIFQAGLVWVHFSTLKDKGMVATLSQLHKERPEQSMACSAMMRLVFGARQAAQILHEQRTIPKGLPLGQWTVYLGLEFGWNKGLYLVL